MSDLPNLELKTAIKQYERGEKLMENEAKKLKILEEFNDSGMNKF